ncbi:THO complex subunit 1 [Exaiptasia diaphana]|uniref:THO complex subunit 1 n=1 Tax=Exaiptasia diaphana TaxID=2652724 RepID=A0A913Y4G3_EXADI|nr:THO complex subunit 1 [Exaiptasia diaphana]KXJ28973.1 THO complex subunit 1 [Exaiptasia diaphana]
MADGYEKTRSTVKNFIEKASGKDAAKELANLSSKLAESDAERKYSVDQAFRDLVKDSLLKDGDVERSEQLIAFAIEACQQGTCSPTLPFILLSDVFDSITLQLCEKLFGFVEEQVSVWTMPLFFSAGKNLLLRMCNDLLRRLSTQQNTVFCGRIQMFLARLFPLSERSGLNLMSQFNLENVTKYNKKTEFESKDQSSDSMITDDGTEILPSAPVDYNLYRKFWALQDFFRNPTQCYTNEGWKKFYQSSKEILNVFNSHKLEHTSRKKLSKNKSNEKPDTPTRKTDSSEEPRYFPKFLTNEKLLDLQLSDSNFRRTILLQFIILFQYLTGTVKFKSNHHVLSELQTVAIKDMTELVYQLMREIPPDGEKFTKVAEHVLDREENWILWKNEGCPSFIKDKEKEPSEVPSKAPRKRTRSFGEEISSGWKSKKIQMGNSELTRLWNLCPNNLEACSSEKRVFLPTLEEYFGEAIEQSDPAAMIEDEYKLIKDSNFGWRALRLLARRSQHFFQPSSNPFKTLPDYLESVVLQLAQELPSVKSEDGAVVENGSTESNP